VTTRFEYVAAGTLDEALTRLREHGSDAKVLAGGQSLVPLLNYRLADPRVVVDINDLPLAQVAADNGRLKLGALVRHHQLEESEEIARRCPVLREAAALIGNVRVRALGTIGGSLAHADAAAELPMVTLALDGRFTLASAGGTRTVGAREFFVGPLTTVMRPDELLTEIEVDAAPPTGWAIEEIARRAGDFAIVAVTALVELDRQGRVARARLAFGGVGPTPVRAVAAEDALTGREPTLERLAETARIARDALSPQSDAFVSGAYRRHVAGVLARRALTRAVERSEARERAGA
jgi:carbon-monoxide dehydrogenase medium subunit